MLKLKDISVKAGEFELRNISIDIAKGDYHILLGPSGSGKTILLETIAGFKRPVSGKIFLHDVDITNFKARERKTGLLFQDYALFPHLTVFENIAFSLKIKKTPPDLVRMKVEQMADLMDVKNLLFRATTTLSGGEKQRIALCRILIHEPDILLLDEPLSSVDAELFKTIRNLLKSLNKKGQTILHVTHNYEEAISMATNISVIEKGEIIQTGSAEELLNLPRNSFVATFTGIRNIYPAKLIQQNEPSEKEARINDRISFKVNTNEPDRDCKLYIRSDEILISELKLISSAQNNFCGIIENISRNAIGFELVVNIGIPVEVRLTSSSLNNLGLKEGKEVWISFKASSVKIL